MIFCHGFFLAYGDPFAEMLCLFKIVHPVLDMQEANIKFCITFLTFYIFYVYRHKIHWLDACKVSDLECNFTKIMREQGT
jgi:hypothetical protein